MAWNWDRINEFASFPEGKRFIVGTVSLLILAGVVIAILDARVDNYAKASAEKEKNCGLEKLQIQKQYSDSVNIISQRYAEKNDAKMQATIDKLEAKGKEMDEALMEAARTMATQNRTRNKLQKVTSTVSKIVKDATN